jgi:hypothetical protein
MPGRRIWLLVACNAPFITGCFGSDTKPDKNTDPACQLDSKSEQTPGYPFDVAKFGSDVMPVLATSCGTANCHAPPTGNGGLIVWANAKPGDCDFAKSFNSAVKLVNLTTPNNSGLVLAVSGGVAGHPLTLDPAKPELATLKTFVSNAATTFAAGGGGGVVAPPGPSPFNAQVFQSTIQPALDTSCALAGCHKDNAGLFLLKPQPAGADLTANFVAVTGIANLQTPENSLIYVQATHPHAGGASRTLDATAAAALLAWITDAKNNAGSVTDTTCAPVDKFNAGTFFQEILPILNGSLDLNAADGKGHGGGCMASQCHGTDRGPGKLTLLPTDNTRTQLQNFVCFVNLAAPSSSEILLCPQDLDGCRKRPHPGQDVLKGADDLNYQRMLAFVYGGKGDVSPLDFAFFVRNINSIFNDVNAVENGAQGRTCADTQSCHGISVAGQTPPNGSDFPIIPVASGLDRLTVNFVSATGFVTFLNPEESSLFLYPTDQIANRADHPFATGQHHPGGADFAIDSEQAKAILTWARGLRPDGDGFQRNWLVEGDFPATLITDQTLVDETTVNPSIFDANGGSFNRGEWDGLFSASNVIDLNQAFPRNATGGRVGYAVSYVVNTIPVPIQAQVQIATQNPVRIYVDGALVAQNDQGGGTSAFVNLKPAGPGAKAVKVLVKLLQRANDPTFSFTAQFRDQLGNLLTDATGELVFTLGPGGGI